MEGRGPGSESVRRGGRGTNNVRRSINTDNEVLGAMLALGKLLTGDVDHVVASVGINIREGMLADGRDELLVEVDPDLSDRVLLGLLNVDNEVRRSVSKRDVVVDELARADVTRDSLSVG